MKVTQAFVGALLVLSSMSAVACGFEDGQVGGVAQADTAPLPRRRVTVLADTCVMDTAQISTLARRETKRVVSEVLILCLVPRADGSVGPSDPSGRAALATLTSDLHALGYKVSYGVAFTDESGQRFDGRATAAAMSRPEWRKKVAASVEELSRAADGVDVNLEKLPDAARDDVTALVTELSTAVRATRKLGVFVPPSVEAPSDLPGGEAFDVPSLARVSDRLRVMTLDYSDRTPGPTFDPGWAVDAVRLARDRSGSVPLDVAYPLYGAEFGPRGIRGVGYLDARGLAAAYGARIDRGPTGAPFFGYRSVEGEDRWVWFDDAESTLRLLRAYTPEVLPADVGVLFWGLGAEDPALFGELARRLP
jgi:hypothetical protein